MTEYNDIVKKLIVAAQKLDDNSYCDEAEVLTKMAMGIGNVGLMPRDTKPNLFEQRMKKITRISQSDPTTSPNDMQSASSTLKQDSQNVSSIINSPTVSAPMLISNISALVEGLSNLSTLASQLTQTPTDEYEQAKTDGNNILQKLVQFSFTNGNAQTIDVNNPDFQEISSEITDLLTRVNNLVQSSVPKKPALDDMQNSESDSNTADNSFDARMYQ